MIGHELNDKAAFRGEHHRPRFSKAPSTTPPEDSLPLSKGGTDFIPFEGYETWTSPFCVTGMVEIPQDEEDEAADALDREMYFREVA